VVKIKMPRERVVVQDAPELNDNNAFYKE